MSGGGSAPQTTTSTNSPPAYAIPGLTFAAGQAQNNYTNAQPQYYPGSTVAPLSSQTNEALQQTQQMAEQGNPTLSSANTQLGNVINNGQTNPFLGGAVSAAVQPLFQQFQQQVLPQIQSQFGLMGRTGSGAEAGAVGQATSAFGQQANNAAAGLAYQSANDSANRQLTGVALAPSTAQSQYLPQQELANVGSVYDSQNAANLQDQVNRYNYQQNLPANSLNQLIAQLQGSSYGGGTATQTRVQQPSSLGLAGGALTGAALGGAVAGPLGAAPGLGIGALMGIGSQNGWF
jgi:hypothetical protein